MASSAPVVPIALGSAIFGLLLFGPVGLILGLVLGVGIGAVIVSNAEEREDRIRELEERVEELESET